MTFTSLLWKFGFMHVNKKRMAPDPLCVHQWRPLCIVYVAGGGKYLQFAGLNDHTPQQIEYCFKLHGFGAEDASRSDWGHPVSEQRR